MNNLLTSKLYNERTFYGQFIRDIQDCSTEVIIESPYITFQRASRLITTLQMLLDRRVSVYVITRNPEDHDTRMRYQAETVVKKFEDMGVQVFATTNFSHRKLAMLDRTILWEGSLNILSQTESREIMRRIDCPKITQECFDFIGLGRFIR